eukprot:scaffold10675_cov89-Cylindrotheca_fusiformis.AAC.4
MSGISFCNSCLVYNESSNSTNQPMLRRQHEDPEIPSSAKELDKFLADSMFQLSFEERENALDDLHGIRNGNENAEDADTMTHLLDELDRNLNDLKKGTLYEQAEENYPSYVSSRDFRIMFLRASDYDPKASVRRLLIFLEVQNSLFGKEKIGKKILLEDLDEEAIESIKSGVLQISASTDRAGRKI